VSKTSSWLVKSLLISAAVALATFALFYGFFSIHKELDVRPTSAYWLGLLAFILSAVVSMIYFRMRAER
jgi:phosphatidylserine synthase